MNNFIFNFDIISAILDSLSNNQKGFVGVVVDLSSFNNQKQLEFKQLFTGYTDYFNTWEFHYAKNENDTETIYKFDNDDRVFKDPSKGLDLVIKEALRCDKTGTVKNDKSVDYIKSLDKSGIYTITEGSKTVFKFTDGKVSNELNILISEYLYPFTLPNAFDSLKSFAPGKFFISFRQNNVKQFKTEIYSFNVDKDGEIIFDGVGSEFSATFISIILVSVILGIIFIVVISTYCYKKYKQMKDDEDSDSEVIKRPSKRNKK